LYGTGSTIIEDDFPDVKNVEGYKYLYKFKKSGCFIYKRKIPGTKKYLTSGSYNKKDIEVRVWLAGTSKEKTIELGKKVWNIVKKEDKKTIIRIAKISTGFLSTIYDVSLFEAGKFYENPDKYRDDEKEEKDYEKAIKHIFNE